MSPLVLLSTGAMTAPGSVSADSEEVETALERLELNCRAAAALGAKTLVLHLWEKPDSDLTLEATAVDEEGRLDPERLTKIAAVVIQLAA